MLLCIFVGVAAPMCCPLSRTRTLHTHAHRHGGGMRRGACGRTARRQTRCLQAAFASPTAARRRTPALCNTPLHRPPQPRAAGHGSGAQRPARRPASAARPRARTRTAAARLAPGARPPGPLARRPARWPDRWWRTTGAMITGIPAFPAIKAIPAATLIASATQPLRYRDCALLPGGRSFTSSFTSSIMMPP